MGKFQRQYPAPGWVPRMMQGERERGGTGERFQEGLNGIS